MTVENAYKIKEFYEEPEEKKSFPRRVFLCLLAVLLAVCIAFDIYVSDYYHTDPAAEDAMVSDRFVSVTEQNGNWVFAPE